MNQDEVLLDDIWKVRKILLDSKATQGVVINQIRLFLVGNPDSYLFARFAQTYPHLWGKYPGLTNEKIASLYDDDQPSAWTLTYAGFENVIHAKNFTEKDLEALADWDVKPEATAETTVFTSQVIDGRTIPFHSEPEWNTYLALKQKSLIQSFRAQSLCITYASYLRGGKQYYPDFIFLTPEGYLAVVESKPIEAMSNFLVQAKYHALAKFCQAHGMIYAMMDEHLESFHQMKQPSTPNEVGEYVNHLMTTARMFNDGAMKFVYAKFKPMIHSTLKQMVARHVIQQRWVNHRYHGFEIRNPRKLNLELLDRNHAQGKEQE